MSDTIDRTALRRFAVELGLAKLSDASLDELAAGVRANRQLAERLPRDLHWGEESALVFRLPIPKEARR